MTGSNKRAGMAGWNPWRVARWVAAAGLLLTPLVMMQISDEWHWEPRSFLAAGVIIGGLVLTYDLAERMSESRAYRAGVAVVLLTSFLTVWTTIVRDDSTGIGFFLVIMAAVVGAFAAWFQPAGMARTMVGVAVMQLLLGVAIATAPSTAISPDGPTRAMLFAGFFTGLWLISAAFFRAASKGSHKAAEAQTYGR